MTGEERAISQAAGPLTGDQIAAELRRMGLARGDIVLTHTALSRLGWVVGGAQTVLAALREVLGAEGTLVMPGFSGQLTDPRRWEDPPVPADWHEPIMAAMPLFDPDATPTRGIGCLPEAFRALPQTARSDHPHVSFLGSGPRAEAVLAGHDLAGQLGPDSPLGRLHEMGAKVLLLGCGYDSCTAFHLAEYLVPGMAVRSVAMPVRREQGRTIWVEVEDVVGFDAPLEQIGAYFEGGRWPISYGFDGAARLFGFRDVVAAACAWATDVPEDQQEERPDGE